MATVHSSHNTEYSVHRQAVYCTICISDGEQLELPCPGLLAAGTPIPKAAAARPIPKSAVDDYDEIRANMEGIKSMKSE